MRDRIPQSACRYTREFRGKCTAVAERSIQLPPRGVDLGVLKCHAQTQKNAGRFHHRFFDRQPRDLRDQYW
jgi:hypothetical protein